MTTKHDKAMMALADKWQADDLLDESIETLNGLLVPQLRSMTIIKERISLVVTKLEALREASK